MAVDRACSILFYMLIAAVTCLMAFRIEPWRGARPYPRVDGRRTRAETLYRLYIAGIFIILFVVSALRFGIGNDYRQYTQTAHEAYVGGYVVTEPGFNMLVKFLYWLTGGEYYEVMFAVFAFFTLWFFFRAFVRQSVSFAQTFFLFMTLGLYFQTFNTVRYYFALSIALCSMKYVLEKDYVRFVFWILIAALFHKSVLIVLPVYWLATFAWKWWQIVLGAVACVGCYLGKSLILKLALVLYPSYKNTMYLESGGMSVISVVRILAVLALYGWFCRYMGGREALQEKSWYRELRFYGQLNLLALAASTFFSFLPVVTRIAYYFGVSQLLLIPLVIGNIEDQRIQKRVKAVVGAACVVYFMVFLLQAHQDGMGLLPYRSWLFETQRYTYK